MNRVGICHRVLRELRCFNDVRSFYWGGHIFQPPFFYHLFPGNLDKVHGDNRVIGMDTRNCVSATFGCRSGGDYGSHGLGGGGQGGSGRYANDCGFRLVTYNPNSPLALQ